MRPSLLVIFFASGAAALIYEVLWLKELGQLFGVTAHAAATTLAVFFLGLAAGGLAWGRRAEKIANPLRAYALLEVGIAGSAMFYFFLLDLYRWLLPHLFATFEGRPGVFLGVKLALATGVLFLPAFLMGGTLPVMGQYLIRRADQLGRTATLLYAVNTSGAAAGALAAGFLLPPLLGFRRSYGLAIAINLAVAAVAYRWSRRESSTAGTSPRPEARRPSAGPTVAPAALEPALIWTLAAVSGFLTLALEVLWTRMFSQVLQNSVYTFAAVLAVFLLALALGSGVAHLLCRAGAPPVTSLHLLLSASGLCVWLTPLVFQRLHPDLQLLGADLGWTRYLAAVFGNTLSVLLIPGVVAGSIFPLLIKLCETRMTSAGRTLGQLASVNTLAAILGSLVAGFVLLEQLGLWASTRLVAGIYLLLALGVVLAGRTTATRRPAGPKHRAAAWAAMPAAGLALAASGAGYGDLSRVTLDAEQGEELVSLREGAGGTVAVVRRGDDLLLKVNNSYQLGTARATPNQRIQAYLPLSLHPDPKSVFFLGMGTGISVGGALDFDVERVVAAELDPHVAEASRRHFAPYLNGLFDDPRARVVVEDGRYLLAATRERYDVIIGDIFLTYRAGVGSLYTREHFRSVRDRLEPGGLFAQWLPMFDLSEHELGIITRTLLEVFPQVTLWRRGFSPRFPVFALVARVDPEPLDAEQMHANLRRLVERGAVSAELWYQNIPLAAYAGNPSATPEDYADYPLSTDDRRPLEYLSPITERNSQARLRDSQDSGTASTLAWLPLAEHCRRRFERLPPARDPYLANLDPRQRSQVEAGLAYQTYEAHRRLGHEQDATDALRRYRRLIATP